MAFCKLGHNNEEYKLSSTFFVILTAYDDDQSDNVEQASYKIKIDVDGHCCWSIGFKKITVDYYSTREIIN